MTTLAANLSDSATEMRVNAAVADPAEYYTIDSEVIRVAAVSTTLSPSLSPVREVDDTLWQIAERGVGATAAASHLSGATLTPFPGAGGGAAEPGTVVVQLTGAETTYAHVYRGDEDPETDFSGELEAGDLWIDTSTDPPFAHLIRAAGNTTWVPAPLVAKDVNGDPAGIVRASVLLESGGGLTLSSFDALGVLANSLVLTTSGDFVVANGDGSVAISVVAGDIIINSGDFAVSIGADGAVVLGDVTNGAQVAIGTNGAITIQNADQSGSFVIDNLGAIEASGLTVRLNLPTADPAAAGALWSDTGTVKVSAG